MFLLFKSLPTHTSSLFHRNATVKTTKGSFLRSSTSCDSWYTMTHGAVGSSSAASSAANRLHQENRGRFATCSHKRKQATPPSKEAQWSFVVSYHNQFSLLLFLVFSMMFQFLFISQCKFFYQSNMARTLLVVVVKLEACSK